METEVNKLLQKWRDNPGSNRTTNRQPLDPLSRINISRAR